MMKFSIVATSVLLLFTEANAQTEKQKEYTIKGTVKGVNTGVVKMLSDDGITATDSAAIVNGKFILRGNVNLPERRAFSIAPLNLSFQGFVEGGHITFFIDTIDAQHQYFNKKDYPLVWQIKESGSEIANVYKRYQDETEQTNYLNLKKRLKMGATKAERDTIKTKLTSIGGLMVEKQKKWIKNYADLHPESIAGVYIFNELCNISISDMSLNYIQSVFGQFSGLAKNSVYYKKLANTIADFKNQQVNTKAPDFTLLKRDRSAFTLSATRGKITMIDFWASWCAPCRAAIPNWKKVYEKYHPKGFEIISVADDNVWKNWITALDKEKMPWIQLVDEFPKHGSGKVGELFGTTTIPFYILLDKEGKIILATGNEALMTKKIDEAMQ